MILRFLTGFFLAGVYPPGMKILATWFRRGRGAALGILVGGIALGKAFPYLVNAVGHSSWRVNVLVVSGFAVAGGAIVLLFVGDGPYATPAARFDASQIAKVFGNRGVRLADFGYFGHMWELYAMWTWVPVFLRASFAAHGARPSLAEGGVVSRHRQRRDRLRGGGTARGPGRQDGGDVVGDGRSPVRAASSSGCSSTRRPASCSSSPRCGARPSSPTRRSSRHA